MERQILDSQERAFWNVHRPPVRIKDCNHSQCLKIYPCAASLEMSLKDYRRVEQGLFVTRK